MMVGEEKLVEPQLLVFVPIGQIQTIQQHTRCIKHTSTSANFFEYFDFNFGKTFSA